MTTSIRRWISAGLRGFWLAVVFFIGLEWSARIQDALMWKAPLLGPYSHGHLMIWDSLGPRNRPGYRFEKWRINTAGFRGPEMPHAPRPDVVRVGVLGASETFGLFESEGAEYPARLGALLDSLAPGRFEVVNLAVPGMSLRAMGPYYRGVVSRIKPKLVLIYTSPSFYLDNEAPGVEQFSAQARDRAPDERSTRAMPALALPSLRFVPKAEATAKRTIPLRWQRAVKDWQVDRARRNHPADWVWHSVPEERMALYRDHLDELVRTIRDDGVEVILVTHTNRLRKPAEFLTPEDWYHLTAILALFPRAPAQAVADVDSAANEAIRSVARKHRLGIIEVEDEIPPTAEYFADYAHFTDAGAAAMAGILASGVVAWEGQRKQGGERH
jgi:hypothetical protein